MSRVFTSLEEFKEAYFPEPDTIYLPSDPEMEIDAIIEEAVQRFEEGLHAVFARLGQTAVKGQDAA